MIEAGKLGGLVREQTRVRIASTARTGPMIGSAEYDIPGPADVGAECTFRFLEADDPAMTWDILYLRTDDGRHLQAVNEDLELV